MRCWCRGFLPDSFRSGPLTAEFFPAGEEVGGSFPSYVGATVFDRLKVINDCPDWDRCLVLDYDQLALCDISPLFDLEMGENLVAAKKHGAGIDLSYAMRNWIKLPFPLGWENTGSYDYFSMGVLLNLKEMREAGTWRKLVAAQEAFNADENLSLVAATDGQTINIDPKWNLFPRMDFPETDLPDGIVHWLGLPKPWHGGSTVWRADIWEAERASWEHLRLGIWDKPLALELDPQDLSRSLDLVKRGWRVKIFWSYDALDGKLNIERLSDLDASSGGPDEFRKFISSAPKEPDMVRVGAWMESSIWLHGCCFPKYLVLSGARSAAELDGIRALGYGLESQVNSSDWPIGGVLPRALHYNSCKFETASGGSYDTYFSFAASAPSDSRISIGRCERECPEPSAVRVGICVLALKSPRLSIVAMLRSLQRNFFPRAKLTVFLFSDEDRGFEELDVDVNVNPISPDLFLALDRYSVIRDSAFRGIFADVDYLYYMRSDMRVVDLIGEEILGSSVAVRHPGFLEQSKAALPWERRSTSTAFVKNGEGDIYFSSAFLGGSRSMFVTAAETLASRIETDRRKMITATWFEESHLNRYLIDYPPEVILPASYCWYGDGRIADPLPKISVGAENPEAKTFIGHISG